MQENCSTVVSLGDTLLHTDFDHCAHGELHGVVLHSTPLHQSQPPLSEDVPRQRGDHKHCRQKGMPLEGRGHSAFFSLLGRLAHIEMDLIVDPRLGEISAWPCLVVS